MNPSVTGGIELLLAALPLKLSEIEAGPISGPLKRGARAKDLSCVMTWAVAGGNMSSLANLFFSFETSQDAQKLE